MRDTQADDCQLDYRLRSELRIFGLMFSRIYDVTFNPSPLDSHKYLMSGLVK